jgi:hypothetical protein
VGNQTYDKEDTMDKRIVDGLVGVVFSPGYGLGISHPDYPQLNFDPKLIDFVVIGLIGDALAYIEETYPNVYIDDRTELEVKFLPVGTKFLISDYDGYEYIVTENDLTLTA